MGLVRANVLCCGCSCNGTFLGLDTTNTLAMALALHSVFHFHVENAIAVSVVGTEAFGPAVLSPVAFAFVYLELCLGETVKVG